ncbi:MAG: ZPR1 zinc finger domain-containing protein [Methanospirillum sp.]|nr:ZPR1 zinc finger domain-containing protein [Methanospirillum sp.]
MGEAAAGQRVVVNGPCAACGEECEYVYQTETIPFFSDILIISAFCPACGYRYANTQMLAEGEPLRFTFRVESPDDLVVRVVRSMTGRLRIPELGVEIDPGPACEGFVTNVEGVLDRVLSVVEGVLVWAEGGERSRAELLRTEIEGAKAGEFPITLVLEDPTGNSAIVSDRAAREPYASADARPEE